MGAALGTNNRQRSGVQHQHRHFNNRFIALLIPARAAAELRAPAPELYPPAVRSPVRLIEFPESSHYEYWPHAKFLLPIRPKTFFHPPLTGQNTRQIARFLRLGVWWYSDKLHSISIADYRLQMIFQMIWCMSDTHRLPRARHPITGGFGDLFCTPRSSFVAYLLRMHLKRFPNWTQRAKLPARISACECDLLRQNH